VGCTKGQGLRFGILNLSGSGLHHYIQYFSIVKKETGSHPMDVGILLNHINSLCTCVIGVFSRVFSFQTCLSYKGLGNWLPINYQFSQQLVLELGCRFLLVKKKCSP
jgi:hypothetical protein